MINITFIRQNVSYHIFNIQLLSLLENNNLLNSILELKNPQIVYVFYKYNTQKQNTTSSIFHHNNTQVALSDRNKFNSTAVTEVLLSNKPKTRQKKRNRSKDYSQYDLDLLKENQKESEVLIRPTQYSQQNTCTNQNAEFATITDRTTNYTNTSNSQFSTVININKPISIYELSKLISVSESEIIRLLFCQGMNLTINQMLGIEIATSIAKKYYFSVVNQEDETDVFINDSPNVVLDKAEPRKPIITILGDLSHGKTSLVNVLLGKKDNHNHLTQLIEVYDGSIFYDNNEKKVIIVDTPGHEVFESMRSLSIKLADLIVLVININQGLTNVSVQIIENAKKNKTPFLIAINIIDMQKDYTQLKENLFNHNVFLEFKTNNIDIPIVLINAKTGENINLLLFSITKYIKKLNLLTSPSQPASGIIYNAYLDKNQGMVLNAILQTGTLQVGDFIVSDSNFGKVRVIRSLQKTKLQLAGPSSSIEILGFSQISSVSCKFIAVSDEKKAKKIAKQSPEKSSILSLKQRLNSGISTNVFQNSLGTDKTNKIQLIVKTDTLASVEAILLLLLNASQLNAQLYVTSIFTGMVTETDIRLAIITKSIVIGFNARITLKAQQAAKKYRVNIYQYKFIYDLVNGLDNYINHLFTIKQTKSYIGSATVSLVFRLAKKTVAGCIANFGNIALNASVEILRNKTVVHKGTLESLKHMKNDILEVKKGDQFGASVTNFDDWQVNDEIRSYNNISSC